MSTHKRKHSKGGADFSLEKNAVRGDCARLVQEVFQRPRCGPPVLPALGSTTAMSRLCDDALARRHGAPRIGQDLGGGATQAQIIGGGLLEGTTAAQFVITGISGTIVSFAGPVTFTTNRGTLTVTVTGTLDVASGAFSASGPVTDATGKLEGATGSLSIDGTQDLATGAFEEDITGEICVDLSPLK